MFLHRDNKVALYCIVLYIHTQHVDPLRVATRGAADAAELHAGRGEPRAGDPGRAAGGLRSLRVPRLAGEHLHRVRLSGEELQTQHRR